MKIHEVQIVRKIVLSVAILVGVLVFALTNSNHPSGETVHEMIEWTGIVAIVICVLGRTWTSLYIGGRKIEQLVTEGPYSVTRNPLYFFSILGAAGAGAQLGSVVSGRISGVLAWVAWCCKRSASSPLATVPTSLVTSVGSHASGQILGCGETYQRSL